MTRARHALALLATVTAAGLLTGCGTQSETTSATSSPPDASSSRATGSTSSDPTATAPSPTSSASSASSTPGQLSAGETKPPSTTASQSSTGGRGTPQHSAAGNGTGPIGVPGRLSMPALGFDQPVRALGLNGGAIDPPPHVVQWYTGSPRPGAPGISVIAGHVAPYGGKPGIFSRLDRLTPGDKITVSDSNGTPRSYTVYAKEAVNKQALQRDPRVWGKSSTPVIALITCDNDSTEIAGHRVKNYVVWAR